MKTINLYTEEGYHFTIEAREIAINRAGYYADREDGGQQVFDDEFEYTINDNDELTDWLLNNMNWYDCDTLKKVPKKEPRADQQLIRDLEVL